MVNLEADRFVHLLEKCLQFYGSAKCIYSRMSHGDAFGGADYAVQVVASAKQTEIESRNMQQQHQFVNLSVGQALSLPLQRLNTMALSLATSREYLIFADLQLGRLSIIFHRFAVVSLCFSPCIFVSFYRIFGFSLPFVCLWLSRLSAFRVRRVMSCACKLHP